MMGAKRAAVFALGVLLLAACFVGWVVSFVRAEHTLYGWDFLTYWKLSAGIVNLREHSIARALAGIGYSFRFDYNYLTLLPSALMMDLFGTTSRFCYVVSNAIFLTVPALLLCHWLFVGSNRATWPQVLFSLLALLTLLLVPLPWVVTLTGMSDVGGLLMAAIATDLLRRTALDAKDPWRWLACGAALALTALSKRWYLYLVIGLLVVFFAEVGLAFLAAVWRARSLTFAAIRSAIFGPVLCLCGLVAVYSLSFPLPYRILTTDYSHVYSAYQNGDSWGSAIVINFKLIVKRFGAAQLALAAGCFIGALCFARTYRTALYLGIPGVIACLHISHVQTMEDHHMLLLFLAATVLPLYLAGQLMLSCKNSDRSCGWALLVAAVIVGALSFQTVFTARAPFGSSIVQAAFPATRLLPEQRTDLGEIVRLMDTIGHKVDAVPGPSGAADVYVISSSFAFNSSHLQNASFILRQPIPAESHICETCDVDFRDGFPDQLATARLVLLAEPVQTHLGTEQRDVAVPYHLFHDGTGFAQAFTRDPEIFHLDHGIEVTIFERTRASTAGELQALHDEIGLPSLAP
jgi:hypothetical protein